MKLVFRIEKSLGKLISLKSDQKLHKKGKTVQKTEENNG